MKDSTVTARIGIDALIMFAIVAGIAWLTGCSPPSSSAMQQEPTPQGQSTGFAPSPAIEAVLREPDYESHVASLRKRFDLHGFTAVIEKPFVVFGDEDENTVRERADRTVRWSVAHLKKTYFRYDPDHIITIWLFKDKASYEAHCDAFFDIKPHTPFGFYSAAHKSLIMNISTGGGTLVHEIVHPFMAANFPACPSWFNEGLASLYEQCNEEDGNIVGLTNWRLQGLQRAIEGDRLPEFKVLLATTRAGFYEEDPGTNYAQARFLCYYLQQEGKLVDFYREFSTNWEDDPTGEQALARILSISDWSAFQSDWQTFVMGLKFP